MVDGTSDSVGLDANVFLRFFFLLENGYCLTQQPPLIIIIFFGFFIVHVDILTPLSNFYLCTRKRKVHMGIFFFLFFFWVKIKLVIGVFSNLKLKVLNFEKYLNRLSCLNFCLFLSRK
jgi:hypothetical protein